jgi:ferredoxin
MGKLYKYIMVDRDLCIGAASCIAVYPEIFELDEENKAVILRKDGVKISDKTDVSLLSCQNVDDDQLLLAAQSCPTAAIFLYDETGKQLYPDI